MDKYLMIIGVISFLYGLGVVVFKGERRSDGYTYFTPSQYSRFHISIAICIICSFIFFIKLFTL